MDGRPVRSKVLGHLAEILEEQSYDLVALDEIIPQRDGKPTELLHDELYELKAA